MKQIDREEMRREIPEKFRASTDAADKAAYELLQENDKNQRELAEKVNVPFASQTPKDRERSNALITICAYEQLADSQKLFPHQSEELAEAYAATGQYEKAARTTLRPEKRAEFLKYHEAVWLDDADWCAHADGEKYIKDYVWSIRENKEMPLLACNECGKWNVLDAPERLLKAQSVRAEIRAAYQKMSEPEFQSFIEQYRRKM